METQVKNEEHDPAVAGQVPTTVGYNPVEVNMPNLLGAFFLGITTLILLVALLRSEARNRALLEGSSPNTAT